MLLLDLPNELLFQISEDLPTEKDILSFAQINSRLYDLTVAHLYRFNAKRSENSALLWAATHGRLATAKKALKEQSSSDDDGAQSVSAIEAALMLAAANDHEEIVRLLVGNGARLHHYDQDRRRNAMEIAAEQGHTRIVKLLLDLGANPGAGLGNKPFSIQFAAMGGHVEIVCLLIDAGEEPDRCSGRPGGGSYTPLQAAALTDNEELARLLLDKGARVNHRSAKGDTPLELAVMHNSPRCLKLLLESGAKVYSRNHRYVRRPALELAMQPGRKQCLELLQNETVHLYSEAMDN